MRLWAKGQWRHRGLGGRLWDLFKLSVVRFFDFEDEFLLTFLGVEFAIEDCFYHVAQSALA